jgi:hypothetical protein
MKYSIMKHEACRSGSVKYECEISVSGNKIRIIKFIIIPLTLLAVHIGCTKEESGKNNLIDFRDSHSIKSQKPILIARRGGVMTA